MISHQDSVRVLGSGFLGSGIRESLQLASCSNDRSLGFLHTLDVSEKFRQKNELAKNPPKLMINASGPASVHDSLSKANYYLEEPRRQVTAHLELLRECDNPPVYIFISSGAVYGETSLSGATESSDTQPKSPYARGKLFAEEVIQTLGSRWGIPWLIMRVFSAYSEDLRTRLPFEIVSQGTKNRRVTLGGTGEELRDFVHVTDLANAISHLGLHTTPNQVFNVGAGESISVAQIASLAETTFSSQGAPLESRISFTGTVRPGDPRVLLADITKLRKNYQKPFLHPISGLEEYFLCNIRRELG